jgi:PKD repeat protein
MKQLLKNAKAIVTIFILTICFIGCDNGDDNLPTITAGFTHTINPYTGTVTFINTSSDVKYYLWTFGDGTTSKDINP